MDKEEKKLDKKGLMEKYSDYILSRGKRPMNVYVFSKENGFSESDFYQYFASFEALEKEFLVYFFDQSIELTRQMEGYSDFGAKEKLLNFYYVFFENLNLNRSLVLMILESCFSSGFQKLKPLKKHHRDFVQLLDIKDWNFFEKLPDKMKGSEEKSQEEILWIHFLSVLKFWKKDQSVGFEDTDIYIEKSIQTGFDLVGNSVIEEVFDLGKFLWKKHF